jgi:hypothetical protein
VELGSFDIVRVHGVACLLLARKEKEIGDGNYHDRKDDKAQWL